MLPTMLEQDRMRAGWSVGQAAWRLDVSVREYRGLLVNIADHQEERDSTKARPSA
jgi:hypothetical protein